MSRALILSGGAFRGAVQVPVIEHLFGEHTYDFVYGVSVGALNGVMFAQHKLELLRSLWEDIDNVKSFLSLHWWWPWQGVYSMKPLRTMLETHSSLEELQIPFAAGVVSMTNGLYYNVESSLMRKDKELWDAVHGSSAIAGIMQLPKIEIYGNSHLGADGGFRNIIPVPPQGEYTHIDVVTCTPLDRVHQELDLNSVFKQAARGIEIMEDEIFTRDISEIRNRSNPGAKITIYSPQSDVGPSFKADKKTIQHRFKLGEEAIAHPLRL